MKLDLSFFLEPPDKSEQAQLEIAALAPLSMVSSQPGTYFRTEFTPTVSMIYGLLENALGWHFEDKLRRQFFKALQMKAKKKEGKSSKFADSAWLNNKPEESGSGFFSLLQFHLDISKEKTEEPVFTYDDLWSMHLRTKGDSFIGGSRNYDNRLEGLITISRDKSQDDKSKKKKPLITFSDKKDHKTYSLEQLRVLTAGKVKTTSLKTFFPHYYASPKIRGYVIPKSSFKYNINCTEQLAGLLQSAIDNPAAPLYLGTNDGWVDLKWLNYE